MSFTQFQSGRSFGHFHKCEKCGNTFRKDDFDNIAVATGIYPCRICGFEGPLNVVIIEIVEPENPDHNLKA